MRVTPTLAPASILGPLTQNGLTKKLVLILHFEFCTLHLFSLPALPINILAPSTYNCNAPRRLCQIKCNYFGSPFWVSGPKMDAGANAGVTRRKVSNFCAQINVGRCAVTILIQPKPFPKKVWRGVGDLSSKGPPQKPRP